MTYSTKGIVLRCIKYGETSIIATIFTELFGVQTYMVNGVRSTKKSSAKANLFQPGAMLDLQVYHREHKTMQRIKEFKWGHLYMHIFNDVIKNSIVLYMVELLHKCLKQPEENTALFYFCEDALQQLDEADNLVKANFAVFFSLQLTHFFGFKPHMTATSHQINYFDLVEGCFVESQPMHENYVSGEASKILADFLKVMQPHELKEFELNGSIRKKLLMICQNYYALHIHDFGQMKTLSVLSEVL